MCDEGKDRFWGALRIFLAENGAAGQISLRNTGLEADFFDWWCYLSNGAAEQ